ncbi:hypothetical protein Tco_0931417, partial [Tanacetum coccineum]
YKIKMDSMIPIGQKNTLAEYMILSGADNRPPMLDKDLFAKDLWEIIQLLMQDLHTTNFDKLHAYLQQHELYANEVRIMRERNHDPLALVANHQQTPSHSNTYQSSYNNPQLQKQFSPSPSPQYGSIHPTQHYSTTYPSTPLAISYPSTSYLNAYTSTVHQDAYPQPQSGKQGSFAAGTSGTRANISGTRRNISGQQRVVKDKVLLVEAQGNGKVLNKEELEFLADPGIAEGPVTQTVIRHNEAYQADDLDAYDSDYDDFFKAKAVLMANLSSYGSDVLYEDTNSSAQQDVMILYVFEQLSNQVTKCNKVNKDNLIANESLYAELKRYKERVKLLEERQNVDLSQSAQIVHMLTEPQVFYDNNLKQDLGFQNIFYFKKAQQIRPMLYDGSVITKETNVISIAASEETLMLEEESRSKMILKQSDPMVLEKKVKTKPINYAELNRLSKDFSKRFILQQELSNEQAFRLQTSHHNTDQSASSLVKIKAPRELPKKGNGGFEHTKAIFLKEIIPFLKTLRDIFNVFDKDLLNEITEVQIVFNQMEVVVQYSLLDINTSVNVNSSVAMFDYVELIKNDLRKFKGKDIVDNAAKVSNATTIAPGMYKLDPVTLVPKDKNNRETHIYYLKHTIEQAAILREIVEQSKLRNLLDSASYSDLIRSTKSSRSKSTDNTKNDMILQISSSTQKKNKVEDHSRIVKSCLNKPICVVEPSGNANVQHSKLNTNSELMCVKCNSSMFDARHELCFLKFVSDMNASSKSKFVKKAKKKEEWKPTGKVFTKIGYNWRPT